MAESGAADAVPEYHTREQEPDVAIPTSRICIKNLPKQADENRLREHFSAKGEVTDAKIMRTRDGKTRCFGFVGFASAQQAEEAVKYFNKSFMDSCRLVVEFAFKYGNQQEQQNRAWSRYTEGTSANKRAKLSDITGANAVPIDSTAAAAKNNKRKKEPAPEEQDPKLKEFLNLMAPRSQKPIWANDDLEAGIQQNNIAGSGQPAAGSDKMLVDDGDSEDELYEDLPLDNDDGDQIGVKSKKTKRKSTAAGSDDDTEEDDVPPSEKDGAVVDAGVSDMDYLRSRMRRNFDDDDEQKGGSQDEDEEIDSEEDESSDDDNDARLNRKKQEDEVKAKKEVDKDVFKAAIRETEAEDADDIDDIFAGKKPTLKTKKSNTAAADIDTAQEDKEEENDANEDNKEEDNLRGGSSRHIAEHQPEAVTVISETGRLFVRNLPYTALEDDLRAIFEAHGEVKEVHIVQDKLTRRSKGFAMVQFEDPNEALAAYEALDASIFMGRLLHILPGKAAPPPPEAVNAEGLDDPDNAAGANGKSAFKRQKEKDLKAAAGDNKVAWNSLFMRADTVAEAVADHFGVSKAELLDRNAPDMAVRLALGETQVIAKTKKDLGDAGVNITSLESAAGASGKGSSKEKIKRSDKVLLVKNLPYSADTDELQNLFSSIGAVARFVLPDTKTLALVEFVEASEAKRAFKTLAYKRYQHVPLYLEWAPVDVFSGPPPAAVKKAAPTSVDKEGDAKQLLTTTSPSNNKGKATAEGLTTATVDDDSSIESSTIFIKNLAFKTVESSLSKHFEKAAPRAGVIRSVKIATKKSAKDGKMLSAGFGFVECSDEAVARAVIKSLQGSTLDGHKLVLQLAQSKAANSEKQQKKKQAGIAAHGKENTKVVVRNVAFEATRQDIMGLFTPFGQVKSCRLPRKYDGTPRGFAFVEFSTPQEAVNAIEAVQGTHLYGRRLVIEWAEEDGGLDELRAKTAKKYVDEGEDPADRR